MIVTSSPVMTDTVGGPGSRIMSALQIASPTATGSFEAVGLGLLVSEGVDETGDGSTVGSAIVAVEEGPVDEAEPPHPPRLTPTTITEIAKRRDAMSNSLRYR